MQTVILAAGRGTRLAPVTDTLPKVMVPVDGQPLIERISRQLVANGLREQIMVVGYLKEKIIAHVGDGHQWGAAVTYVEQTELGGTGHAVLTAAPHVRDDSIMVFGDSLLQTKMVERVAQTKTAGAIGCAQVAEPSRYGILSVDEHMHVTALVEKPKNPPSNLAIMAIYKLPFAVLEALKNVGKSERGEIELPDAVRTLIKNGVVFSAIDITGVMDVGTLPDLERANASVKAVL